MACGTRAFCLDLHYNPGVKLHHELRGSPSTWNGIHLVYEFLFPIFFFFFALIIIAGTSSIAGKTDKIIFLIPLFDCFITWVTQSKGSRGPMHSRHYAGNLFSLAWPQSQSCMCGVWLFLVLFSWYVRGYGGFSRFSPQLS